MGKDAFLADRPGARPWSLPDGVTGAFTASAYYLGCGESPLEVAIAEAPARPSLADVRTLWKRRQGGTRSPLLLVVLYGQGNQRQAALCGPAGNSPSLIYDLDPAMVERVAHAALAEPNRHAAVRFLSEVLGGLESKLPGLRNEGLLATHGLRVGVPTRADWQAACAHGQTLLAKRGRELIEGLGFTIQPRDNATFTLRAGASGTATAVAIFLDQNDSFEGAQRRFGGSSPVSLALARADADRLPFVVVTRGAQIRLYAADKRIVGVGRKGRSETFLQADLALLPPKAAGYLPLLFGAQALLPEGSFEQILERSKNYAADLSKRLRERVYAEVVPGLATAIARGLAATKKLSEDDLSFVYEQALFILFRLVFIAYAEDKGLLPFASNEIYRQHALKTLAQQLAQRCNAGEVTFDAHATDLWGDVQQLFRAVDQGNADWGVPAYDGGLFSAKPDVSPAGAAVEELELSNAEFGPPLTALLVDVGEEQAFGAIDFRSLSVREFGTIYEGLLESSLSIAQSDLTTDKAGIYVPAKDGHSVEVRAGEVYLHNQSGARKATGSYFTKEFAVEHLLDHALEPALDQHGQQGRHLRVRLHADCRRDVDDVSPVAADHMLGSGLRWIEEPFQVRVDQTIQILRHVGRDRLCDEYAGVVDQHVDLPESIDTGVDQTARRLRQRYVAGHSQELLGEPERSRRRIQPILGAAVSDDVVASLQVRLGQRVSDAARCSRDHHGTLRGLHVRSLVGLCRFSSHVGPGSPA